MKSRMGFPVDYLHLPRPTAKIGVKLMYIPTAIISKMLINITEITNGVKYDVAYGLSIGIIKLRRDRKSKYVRWNGMSTNIYAFLFANVQWTQQELGYNM